MAGRLTIAIGILAALLLMAGCGVKTPPLASSEIAPRPVRDLRAIPRADGVEVSFSVPRADKPRRRITQVRLYYAYLPLTGDPACPPCPPRLHRFHRFDLTGQASKLMEGGRFAYLDRRAPLGKEAVYQVVLVDAAGRVGRPSGLARAPRVTPPPPPAGLKAEPGDTMIKLSWQGGKVAPDEADGLAGWVVWRKGPDGARRLNQRPLREPALIDRSVVNGQSYTYRVASVSRVGGRLVYGDYGPALEVAAKDQTPPAPPTDLMAMTQPSGVFLRFTPSPDQDTAGYIIYRAEKKNGPWRRVSPELVVENVFMDQGADPKKVHYYRVVAVDEAGNQSKPSQVLELKPIVD